MSEVLLGQSYYLRFDPKLWEAMQPYPPLGTLYAASYIRERGYDVALFDAMLAESEAEWEQALQREQPRFAVIFEDNFNYLSKMCLLRMREAAYTMIRMARETGATVIAAGADASDNGESYLASGADYVLYGEGDATLAELLDHLTGRSTTPLADIQGLIYRDPEQGLVQTARRPDLKDLDALPFPAWELVDIPRYQAIWREHHGYYSMNMVTTRGCPFHCNWCAKPIWGQRYNARSPENVAQELKWLKERFQPDHLWFVDDIMGLKPGWLERFATRVEELDAKVPFKSLNRVDLLLRGDAVNALKRAGAKTIWMGAESGSQKILDAMEKGTRVEQIYEAASRLHAAGIEVGFFLQFGYPGETREDIEMTLQMVRDCKPDDVGMSVSYPLPGTKFHDWVRDQLGVKQNWLDSNDLAMLYKGTYTTDFYRQLHRVLHKEFRARKNRESLTRTLRRPKQVRPQHLRQVAAMTAQLASLPIERRKLNRLEHQPRTGSPQIQIPLVLDPAAASRPSAQPARPEGEQPR
ncbi:MAG TPA: radical SAM protein [Thermomicrobiales bacterium]|nr:radical SAM protein [Thermomicrobiales bacterium]